MLIDHYKLQIVDHYKLQNQPFHQIISLKRKLACDQDLKTTRIIKIYIAIHPYAQYMCDAGSRSNE